MNAVYVCQWCKCKDSQARRAPTTVLGTSVFEQWVCSKCEEKAKASIDKFWKCENKEAKGSQCCHCSCSLKGKAYFMAQHSPVGDGSWSTRKVCEGCFKDFCNACSDCASECQTATK